ncbi:hypothetical protein PMAYCL1PPCAC_08390, partial [Pristionchus mayeri]
DLKPRTEFIESILINSEEEARVELLQSNNDRPFICASHVDVNVSRDMHSRTNVKVAQQRRIPDPKEKPYYLNQKINNDRF